MELWKRKNSYAEFTKYPQTFNCHTWNCKPWRFKTPLAVSKWKKFPWLKQITSLPLSLNGRQDSELLLQTMNTEVHAALPFSPLTKVDSPLHHLVTDSSRILVLQSQDSGWIIYIYPMFLVGFFTGPWGFWGHSLCLKSPGWELLLG